MDELLKLIDSDEGDKYIKKQIQKASKANKITQEQETDLLSRLEKRVSLSNHYLASKEFNQALFEFMKETQKSFNENKQNKKSMSSEADIEEAIHNYIVNPEKPYKGSVSRVNTRGFD